VAGAGLCHPKIIDLCVEQGPERVRELIELGVEFTKNTVITTDPTEIFDLHREGGHGQRRILHADDLTGLAIEKALLQQIQKHPQIQILENHIAIDLITTRKISKKLSPSTHTEHCLGAYVLDRTTGKILTIAANATLLATGGAGKVYLYTTNPDVATGDGIAMAYRAGAQVANLEFMQFHPTCLYHPSARTFLISEALRGEGAVLRTLKGDDFMKKHHPMGSLAPRDQVARAIDLEMKRSGDKHVILDCSAISTNDLKNKFPNIYETCLNYGIDITRQSIPVVPAAHYLCGGVCVDASARTTINHLYAIGEVACTGLHGANRLASNSLLEAVVFAHAAAQDFKQRLEKDPTHFQNALQQLPHPLPEWDSGPAVAIEEQIDIASNWLEIRSLMWNYVGIVRSNRRLERAQNRLALLRKEIDTYYWNYLLTQDLIELRNLLTLSELMVHYTVDYPNLDDVNYSKDTILKRI
jgi:L-aspartate oxidase